MRDSTDAVTVDMFGASAFDAREIMIRARFAALRAEGWNPLKRPEIINEPSEADKAAFVEAFIRASRP